MGGADLRHAGHLRPRGRAAGLALAAGLAAALSLAPNGQAVAAPRVPQASFLMLPALANDPGMERVAKPNQALIIQWMVSPRAVRLEASGADALAGRASKAPTLAAGTLLYGVWANDGWAYCVVFPTPFVQSSNVDTPCFQDVDGDGAFETLREGVNALNYSWGLWPNTLAFGIGPNGVVTDFGMGPGRPLSRSIAYSSVAPALGPKVRYGLYWIRDGDFSVTLGGVVDDPSANAFVDPGVTALLQSDGPTRVQFHGAVIDLLGLTSDGALRYRIETPMPSQFLVFDYRRYIQPQTIVIYH
jgi:hypothetical protein